LILMVTATIGLQLAIVYRQFNQSPQATAQAAHGLSSAARPNVTPSTAVGMEVDLSKFAVQGENSAKVAVVEFSDYECPFCAKYVAETLPALRKQFVETGKVRYAFGNLPLASHANARLLATAAICAGEQDQYWRMHDELFRTLPRTREAIVALADQLRLKPDAFQTCLTSAAATNRLERDRQQAQEFGLIATPTFLIGAIDPTGRVTVQRMIVGAESLAVFAQAVNDILGTNLKSN
jgi:protein-disulfide isomerase